MDKHKIAIVGPKDAILGFQALGLEAHSALDTEQALETLQKLVKTKIGSEDSSVPAYAIIFIIEDLATGINHDEMKKLSSAALPAIIPIPGPKGTTGYGLKRISKIVEQAVGSDILGDK